MLITIAATVTIRNISRNEITMDAEHLTARFVRGDQNRTTEGSGLGLSIAKSFTEACGGRFHVHNRISCMRHDLAYGFRHPQCIKEAKVPLNGFLPTN